MLKKILTYPHSFLRKPTKPVLKLPDKTLDKVIIDCLETVRFVNGMAIASNQIGYSEKLFVLNPDVETNKDIVNNCGIAIVNPVILKESFEFEIEEEGCLSFPGIKLPIKRSKEIEVCFQDMNGNYFTTKIINGLLAREFQHEIQHLQGILFIDNLNK